MTDNVAQDLAKYVAAVVQGTHEITAVTIKPKREWQGLTDEEVQMFIDARWGDGVNFTHFIRAIEAKLKEKNT
jgi:hypothetical protein